MGFAGVGAGVAARVRADSSASDSSRPRRSASARATSARAAWARSASTSAARCRATMAVDRRLRAGRGGVTGVGEVGQQHQRDHDEGPERRREQVDSRHAEDAGLPAGRLHGVLRSSDGARRSRLRGTGSRDLSMVPWSFSNGRRYHLEIALDILPSGHSACAFRDGYGATAVVPRLVRLEQLLNRTNTAGGNTGGHTLKAQDVILMGTAGVRRCVGPIAAPYQSNLEIAVAIRPPGHSTGPGRDGHCAGAVAPCVASR